MNHDLQNVLDVDPSQCDMKLKFLFYELLAIPIQSIKVTSEVHMKLLIELNQFRKSILYLGKMFPRVNKKISINEIQSRDLLSARLAPETSSLAIWPRKLACVR